MREQQDNSKSDRDPAARQLCYAKRIQAERFGIDPYEVRAYFAFDNAKKGVMNTMQHLFNTRFVRVTDASVWDRNVAADDVLEGKQEVSRFYIDLHPREHKFANAAMLSIAVGFLGCSCRARPWYATFLIQN